MSTKGEGETSLNEAKIIEIVEGVNSGDIDIENMSEEELNVVYTLFKEQAEYALEDSLNQVKTSNDFPFIIGSSGEFQAGAGGGFKVGLQYVISDEEEAIVGYYAAGSLVGAAFGVAGGPIITNATTIDEFEGNFVTLGVSGPLGVFSAVDISASVNSDGKLIMAVTPAVIGVAHGFPEEIHFMFGQAKILDRWEKNDEEFWRQWYEHH